MTFCKLSFVFFYGELYTSDLFHPNRRRQNDSKIPNKRVLRRYYTIILRTFRLNFAYLAYIYCIAQTEVSLSLYKVKFDWRRMT